MESTWHRISVRNSVNFHFFLENIFSLPVLLQHSSRVVSSSREAAHSGGFEWLYNAFLERCSSLFCRFAPSRWQRIEWLFVPFNLGRRRDGVVPPYRETGKGICMMCKAGASSSLGCFGDDKVSTVSTGARGTL